MEGSRAGGLLGDRGFGVQVITIVFTDLVGSTELTRRVGDRAADQIRRTHFSLLREAMAAHGGEEVKSLGDGLMVVFSSTAGAVEFAVAVQQSLERHNRHQGVHPLWVRVGVHVGEPTSEEGDYHGGDVNLAKRVCDAAEGGQILVTEPVRWLVRGRTGLELRPLEALELKGVDEPVAVHEVLWAPQSGAPIPLPAPLRAPGRTPFVGRGDIRRELAEEWKHAAAGERKLVMIAGEPGIGKTRTATDLAGRAHGQGAVVLYGRCDPDGIIPYQPFLEGLAHFVRTCPDAELRSRVGEPGADLARLLPELRDRLPDLPEPAQLDPETERYRLFHSVGHLLSEAAASAPMLFVLDDLHWADRPTLALLRHLMRATAESPILFVATYRDVELGRRHPLTEVLHELRRERSVERILLRGLGEEEVVSFLEAVAEHELDDRGRVLAQALYGETEGNPFFLEEILFHLMESGRLYREGDRWVSDATSVEELEIPEGIREAVGRRLARLSETANEALAQASVIGPRFAVDVLERVTGIGPDALAEALEEARDAQLLVETSEDSVPVYAFAHALVRQVLSEELSLPRRQRLHLRVAESLEDLRRRDPPVGAIAVHYRAAGVAADPQKTVDFSLLAARLSADVYAFEDALAHLEAARDLMREQGADPAGLARVLAYLGDLRYATGLGYERGLEELEEGIRLYEEAGDEVRAAQMRSRLGRNLSSFQEWMDIDRALEQFHAAERVLSRHEPGLPLAYAYNGIAGTALWAVRTSEGLEWSRRAMDLAEALGLRSVWVNACALHGWHTWAAGRPAEGQALLDRAYLAAEEAAPDGSPAGFFAVWIRGFTSLMLYDPVDAKVWFERELVRPYITDSTTLAPRIAHMLCNTLASLGEMDRFFELVAGYGLAGQMPLLDSLIARLDGDLAASERFHELERSQAKARGDRFSFGATTHSLGRVAIDLGDLDRGAGLFLESTEYAREHVPAMINVRTDLVRVLARQGRVEEAERELRWCEEMIGEGTGWRGYPALLAEGWSAVLAARGELEEAERRLEQALEIHRRHSSAYAEWELLRNAIRMFRDAGDRNGASRMFDRFAESTRQYGFGEAWLDLMGAEGA